MKKNLLTLLALAALTSATVAQVPSYVPANGLLGWWPFDGNTNDASGNGNNGVGNNITYDTDRIGNPNQCLFLTGVDNTTNGTYVTVDGTDFNLTNDMSFSVWFKSTDGGVNPMVEKKLNEGYAIYTANGDVNPIGYHSFVFNDQGTPYQTFDQYKVGTFSTIDGNWHHLVVTVSLSPGVVKMYLDGVLDSQSGLNTGGNASNPEDLQFGVWSRGVGNKFFEGNLDDIGIWDRALTDCEVEQLYLSQSLAQTPTVTASGVTTFCSGGSVTLTSSTGNSFLWNNGETTQSITVTQGGIYNVTITDANGCQATSQGMVVTVNPTPNSGVSVSGATTFCSGGSVTLTSQASSGSYLWSSGETTQSITVNQTGNYSVTVTDNGCSATSGTTAVNVNQTPTATIIPQGNTTFCQGGFVVLEASGGGTYQWNTGSQASSINVSQSGTYTVSVIDNGCIDQASLQVTVNSLPNVSLSSFSSICGNAPSVSLAGGSPSGGSYTVNGTPATTLNPAQTGSGQQTVVYSYSDGNGCSNTATQSATVNAVPSVSLSGLNTAYLPTDAPVQLSGSPAGGVFNGTGVSNGQFDSAAAGLGTHSVQYAVVDGNGCIGQDGVCTTVDLTTGSGMGLDNGGNGVEVYPNPSNGLFTVVMDGMDGIVQLSVMDISGREVASQSLTARGRTTHNIDLSGFANGVYTLRIQSAKGTSGIKLVKE